MATTERKTRRLMLDCDICGEPVLLSASRFLELAKLGERPRCRKNGCERLCGAKRTGTSRGSQVLAEQRVGWWIVQWPHTKRGNKNGALAKLAVKRDEARRYEGCCDDG